MWKEVRLGELFRIGSSKRVLKSQWQTKGVPFYRGREVTSLSKYGYVDNELFISEELYKEYSKKYGVPRSGDIVITAIGTIGNSYIVGGEDRFYFKDASVLWLKKSSDVSSEFINYWLNSPLMKRQLGESNGATVNTLTIGKLESLRVKLPSLIEQKRTVAILDEAFAGIETAIANTERNLANTRELFECYLNTALSTVQSTWALERLEDICVLRNGRAYKKSELLNVGKYAVLRVGNFFTNRHWYYSDLELDETKYCDKGDLLYAWSASFGPRIWEGEKVIFHYHIWRVDFDERLVNKKFLYYWLHWDATSIKDEMGAGTTMVHVSMKSMNARRIHLPPLAEQERIVEKLDMLRSDIARIEVIYQQKLASLTELKQSLLQKALSGELTVDTAGAFHEAVA